MGRFLVPSIELFARMVRLLRIKAIVSAGLLLILTVGGFSPGVAYAQGDIVIPPPPIIVGPKETETHQAKQDMADPERAFDPVTGENLNWDRDKKTWVDSKTGKAVPGGFQGARITIKEPIPAKKETAQASPPPAPEAGVGGGKGIRQVVIEPRLLEPSKETTRELGVSFEKAQAQNATTSEAALRDASWACLVLKFRKHKPNLRDPDTPIPVEPERDIVDPTRGFDPNSGRNFVWDSDKKAWIDAKTGECICPECPPKTVAAPPPVSPPSPPEKKKAPSFFFEWGLGGRTSSRPDQK